MLAYGLDLNGWIASNAVSTWKVAASARWRERLRGLVAGDCVGQGLNSCASSNWARAVSVHERRSVIEAEISDSKESEKVRAPVYTANHPVW